MTHAAAEVAVRRGDTFFTSRHDAHVAAQAGAAGRRRNGTAGGDEGFNITGLHGFHVDVLAAGNDDAADVGMDLVAFEDVGCNLQVFQPAVGAGADDDLVDLDVAEGTDDLGIFRQMRESDDGFQFGQVDFHSPAVMSIFVGRDDVVAIGDAALFIGHGLFIDGENAVLGTGFDSHVGNGEAVGHIQGGNAFASKFQGLVEGAVDTDHANKGQHDVFPGNVVGFGARQVDVDGIGDLEPGLARRHGDA